MQRQIAASQAGVLFTADPITKDLSNTICEWVNGPGEALVSGTANPQGGWTWRLGDDAPSELVGTLDDFVKIELWRSMNAILTYFQRPMDIEWVAEGQSLFIVQARPLTVGGGWTDSHITGRAACRGVAKSTVQWGNDRDRDALDRFTPGNLLFAHMTTPKMVPAMLKASGFATVIGGRTCHAAIVARELNKPCVVGAAGILNIGNGAQATIDADNGKVVFNG